MLDRPEDAFVLTCLNAGARHAEAPAVKLDRGTLYPG
jgi:hypothetical protein